MHASSRDLLPPIPPALRFIVVGGLLAAILYVFLFWEPAPSQTTDDPAVPQEQVRVPQLDLGLLAGARSETREERLLQETEPLRHLLAQSIDVVPSVAFALGMPEDPIAVADVRADPRAWQGRWLWYEGEVVHLAGPREGHPIKGRSIYEATLRLPGGEYALAAFTMPPPPEVHMGSWARIEGFMLKLRDLNYPFDVEKAPMLVGREIQRDYEDWGPVTELDPAVLAKIERGKFWPGSAAWNRLEEDQCEALWHLAAFARDTAADRSFAEWRKIGTLNAIDTYPLIQRNRLEPGTPLRLLGTLIRSTTVAAPANPAGIKRWTIALMQVRDFGGHVIPVWVPKEVGLKPRVDLEVRGTYYRQFVYESQDNSRYHVPLFVAADLDPFNLEVDGAARWLSGGLAVMVTICLLLFWWIQRRWAKSSMAHQRHLDARRRQRRERAAAAATTSQTPADNPAL